MATSRLSQFLKKVTIFAGLSDDILAAVEGAMYLANYRDGAEVCREGEAGDRMFVIESGGLSVLKQVEPGTRVEIATLGPGEIAGELSLFGNPIRSASLVAQGETQAWVLDHHTFQELVENHGVLARALLNHVSTHLRRENSIVARLLARDLDPRMKVAFFDAKPYMDDAFREGNRFDYGLTFFEPRLSIDTVSLAAGFKAVCVFVNDKVDAQVVDELAALGVEMIALRCAGFNNVDLEACVERGISVARVPAYSPYAVAEHAVGLMLTLNRKIHRAHNRVREANFSLNGLVGFDLHGKTVGVVGAGKIGRCVVEIMAGFGCQVLISDAYQDAAFAERVGARYVDLDELLAASDVVTLHAPLTPETFHLIDAGAIAKMKPGVMLVNTSRGALVDTVALVAGLKSGQIGYAGLDVYEEESAYFFEDHSDHVMTDDVLARLTTFNNVIVTSHQAFLTRDALANIAATTLDNIREFELGKRGAELTNAVKPLVKAG